MSFRNPPLADIRNPEIQIATHVKGALAMTTSLVFLEARNTKPFFTQVLWDFATLSLFFLCAFVTLEL